MSAYDNQIEREYSAQNLSGNEQSADTSGSEFRMESVVYMSSWKLELLNLPNLIISNIDYDYDYCKMAALNAEISNNIETYNSLSEFCKDYGVKYIKEGHYIRELNSSVALVENYFHGVMPHDDGHDVVLMDLDDLLPANTLRTDPLLYRYNRYGCDDCVREARHMKHVFLIELYKKLESGGWPLVLLSRKRERLRDATIEDLKLVGCGGGSRLIMRSDEGMKMDTRDYFLKQKTAIEAEGYRIRGVISSHMDMLVGAFGKTQNFKLPNTLPVAPTHAIV
ncbi:hypothetical protein SSX86_031091 [Deinandra increscens subsp. villosa]|uniref:Acid phosphatase n=1 Tax=Deinandra increscens subsp. villosa TaxID=3103831 RepID=A0AAP0C622_9ASTR